MLWKCPRYAGITRKDTLHGSARHDICKLLGVQLQELQVLGSTLYIWGCCQEGTQKTLSNTLKYAPQKTRSTRLRRAH